MREKRSSYIKISVFEEEKRAYEAGAAQRSQTLSEWVRLSLRGVLEEAGYNWKKAASAGRSSSDQAADGAGFERYNARLRAQGIPSVSFATYLLAKENGSA